MVQSFVEGVVEDCQGAEDAMTSQKVEGVSGDAVDEEDEDDLTNSRRWSANVREATRSGGRAY